MNESRQTVETDTLWLSKNIRALNFRKPGHLRKYCNNENFPIYGSRYRFPQNLVYTYLILSQLYMTSTIVFLTTINAEQCLKHGSGTIDSCIFLYISSGNDINHDI